MDGNYVQGMLGVEHQLDRSHYIEYTQEDFFAELQKAGLKVENYEVRWARNLSGEPTDR